MKFKLGAGSEIDILTPSEYRVEQEKLRRELRDHDRRELSSVRYISEAAAADANGRCEIRVPGPRASFIWDVRTVTICGEDPLGVVTGRAFIFRSNISSFAYVDSTDPANLVNAIPAVSGWTRHQFPLGPQESILVLVTGAPAGQRLIITARVIELPATEGPTWAQG